MRKSPRRVYSGVKSKVAGNLKTQNRVTGKAIRESWQTIAGLESEGVTNSYIKTAYPKTYSAVLKKPVKTASSRKSMNKSSSTYMSSSKKATAKRPATEDYQTIIDKIKSRFNDEDLKNMSVSDLQAEIMP